MGAGGVPNANNFQYFFDGSSAGLIVLIGMTVLLGISWKNKIKREEFSILTILSVGTLLFLIILSHFNLKLYVSRYFMPAAVMLYILLAGMTTTIFKKASSWLVFFIIFLFLIISLKPIEYKSEWYQASKFIDKNINSLDYIVTTSPFDYTTMRYYKGTDRLKYYNKSNPTEDFSGWVVVGNENRLQTLKEVQALEDYIIVDWTCDWEGLNLKELVDFGELKICK